MLDQGMLSQLTDEQKDKLARWDTMFGSDGWPLLMAWAQASADESKDRVFLAQNWEEAVAWRARWFVMQELLKLKEFTYSEFENLVEAQESDIEFDDLELE